MSYSQGKEDVVVCDYFKGEVLTLLSIGENDGKTFSNSLALIEGGWKALLVEPSFSAMQKLRNLHYKNDSVVLANVAVSDYNGRGRFYESGTHLNTGDTSLLSSLNSNEIRKWKKTTEFEETEVDVVDFKTLLDSSPFLKFQFISIDCEGMDWVVLNQMDLKKLDCKCLCIEHNGDELILNRIMEHCLSFGLRHTLLKNMENIIIAL